MTSRIDWVRGNCRLLLGIAEEFAATRRFDDLTIGTGIHLEPKTVALLLTLKAGGARVVSTGNLNSTQPEAVEYLRAHGVDVVGDRTTDEREHDEYLRQVLAREPHLLLDNGGDLFARYLEHPYERLLGGTEETTSGRVRLSKLRSRLERPILVINDSPIKQYAENRHAGGRDDDVGLPQARGAVRHLETVEAGLQPEDGIRLGDGDRGEGVTEAGRDAPAD